MNIGLFWEEQVLSSNSKEAKQDRKNIQKTTKQVFERNIDNGNIIINRLPSDKV